MKKLAWLGVLVLFLAAKVFASVSEYEADAEQLVQTLKKASAGPVSPKPKPTPLDLRDPMQPLLDKRGNVQQQSGPDQGFVLQGIVWTDKERAVLINGEFYKQGQTVGACRIREIKQNGFVAEVQGETIFVPLYPQQALASTREASDADRKSR